MAYEHPFYYYKHLSQFNLDCVCSYDSGTNHTVIKKISNAHLKTDYCAEHNDGIAELNFILSSDTEVEVDEYEGFSIIRLGTPKNIWLPDEQSKTFMRDDLVKNNGLMAYWDFASVAFITSDSNLVPVIKEFLTNISHITYNESVTYDESGITLNR